MTEASPDQYYDKESGLWYNGFRYYDNHLGTYTESEPIGLVGMSIRMSMSGGAAMFADPLGLQDRLGGVKPAGGPPRIRVGTVRDILYRYANEVQAKNWIGADKFYHCMTMCEAVGLDEEEAAIAGVAGELREINQQ